MRIFIADCQPHIRSALRILLEEDGRFEISGEAECPESMLAQVCLQPPDVILLDWNLPGLHLQRLLATLSAHCPSTRILVTSLDPQQERAVLSSGAQGFLLKNLQPDEFMQSLFAAIK